MNGFNENQMDALKEIVSIGAGNAATALSQLLHQKVNIAVPTVNLTTIDKAQDVFGEPETLVVAVYLQLLGDATGVILVSFRRDEALRLSDILLGREPGKTKMLHEIEESALKESATILIGAYLGALAKILKMRLLVSAPATAQDMAGAVVDNILIEISKEADYTLVIDTELKIIDEKVVTYFFFIPDKDSLGKIFDAIGVK
ncbi:MAG: chemotaxis protein CheC [Candidatus Omnitrophica bacterium]|nr:chemotaxis protein CheC [Candidatus Omnitrophota bacterium]